MTQRTSWRHNSVVLAAAVAAAGALILARPAAAQRAAGGDGHALDASNRVGSGGYNSPSSVGSGVTSNNIAGRGVTGGQGFAGPLPFGEADSRAFSGTLPYAPSSIFSRQSNAPINTTGTPDYSNRPQQYYSDSRFVPPPAGSLPLGFNGGYISDSPNTPSSLSSGFNVATDATSLAARTMNPQTLLLNRALNSADSGSMITQMDQSGTLNVSPVYGVRPLENTPGQFNAQELYDRPTADDLTTLRMQQELRDTSLNPSDINNNSNFNNNPYATKANGNTANGVNAKNPNGLQPDGTPAPAGLNDPLNKPLGPAFDAPLNGPISDRITASQLPSNELPSNGIIPANAGAIPTLIPAAEDQSTLLKTLQSRLQASGGVGKQIVDNQPVRPSQPQGKPTATPAATAVATPNPDQGPVAVSSLAGGIKAKGLRDLLAGSEDLVRKGKYESAIAQYDQALRVAPNNPLPILGRAQAELAGGFYGKAEADLRSVFRSNPELMMMRFDLTKLYPADRITYVHKDLHDLATSDPKAERPWFILAYLDYNTADAAAASKDLNEAEQRSGHGDWSVRLLKQHWTLPEKAAGAEPSAVESIKVGAPPSQPAAAPTPKAEPNK